nr:MAG TPA: hypothetical protein [Caudoviricetes sp.]
MNQSFHFDTIGLRKDLLYRFYLNTILTLGGVGIVFFVY